MLSQSTPPKPADPTPLDDDRPLTAGTPLFAQRVLRRAEGLGYTKKELAARAGLSRQTLDNVLQLGSHGDADMMPSVRTLLSLATALKVHPYWLVEGLMAHARVSMHLKALMQGDRVGFVEDISCPDACVVAPGEHFYKAWSAQNLNEQAWEGRRVVCWDDRVEVRALSFDGTEGPVQRLIPDVREMILDGVPPGGVFGDALGFNGPPDARPCSVVLDAGGQPTVNLASTRALRSG